MIIEWLKHLFQGAKVGYTIRWVPRQRNRGNATAAKCVNPRVAADGNKSNPAGGRG